MKSTALVACSLALAASFAMAEEEAAESAEVVDIGVELPKAKQPQDKPFHMLPLCRVLEGGAEVLRPGEQKWIPLEEGKFYPFGCSYRTTSPASHLTIQFGRVSEVRIAGLASFGTRLQPVGLKDRTIILKSGTIAVSLPRSMPAGMFKVTAPGFTAFDLAGESTYAYENTGDGDLVTVRCVTGAMSVEGRHFRIPAMHAANEFKIRTSQDMLFTGLYGTSGDYIAKLDQGILAVPDPETNELKNQDRKLDWHLSPRTAVRIHRAVPQIGERMSVTVMTFDDLGELVNRCTFCEGRAELSTGEQGEKALKAKEEQTKRAMQETEATTTTEKTTSTEENNETNKEESTEE